LLFAVAEVFRLHSDPVPGNAGINRFWERESARLGIAAEKPCGVAGELAVLRAAMLDDGIKAFGVEV
jgi:hypothetical protein